MPVRNDFAPGEFCWVDLNTHDQAAALHWYGEIFGWSHHQMPVHGGPPYAFAMSGAHGIAGVGQMSAALKAQGIPSHWNSYVNTSDCAATEAKVRELGGQVTVPTMEVPGHGRLAFFLDPSGASFAAWQSTAAGVGLLVGEPTGMCWNELMTRDLPATKAFYGALFGWEFADIPMPGPGGTSFTYTLIKRYGKDAGGIMPMAGPEWGDIPAHWMVYFAVADCAATAAKVGATGGKVCVPPTLIPVGTFSVLSDPQGGTFSIIQLAARLS